MLRLLSRLPPHGHYRAALMDSEEYAEKMLALAPDEDEEEKRRTLLGWSPERGMLADLFDVMVSIRSVLIAANSKDSRVPEPQPYPRPEPAIVRVAEEFRAQQAIQRHEDRVRQMLPKN